MKKAKNCWLKEIDAKKGQDSEDSQGADSGIPFSKEPACGAGACSEDGVSYLTPSAYLYAFRGTWSDLRGVGIWLRRYKL